MAALPKSPFAASTPYPGTGDIKLSLLPPARQVLSSLSFQYPLKLIAPDPHYSSGEDSKHVTVVFLLTYGGGLVSGDKITLRIELDALTRLALVTQGSTKLFKSPSRSIVSGQTVDAKIGAGAGLCYLPDPTQPFAESIYEQKQTFYVEPDGSSSLLVLDWVSEGRKARSESWRLWGWKGRNEVRLFDESGRGRLLLRDAVVLTDDKLGGVGLSDKTNGMGIFGTLIIYGPLFKSLGQHFVELFGKQPRIGAKNFHSGDQPKTRSSQIEGVAVEVERAYEEFEGLLWTAANVRGFVLVKFGARDIDGARSWLGGLLRLEGTVERHFGHQALLCLR